MDVKSAIPVERMKELLAKKDSVKEPPLVPQPQPRPEVVVEEKPAKKELKEEILNHHHHYIHYVPYYPGNG